MKAIELIGDIDEQHRLHARAPAEIPTGQVRLILLLPGENVAGWSLGRRSCLRVVGRTGRFSRGYLRLQPKLRQPSSLDTDSSGSLRTRVCASQLGHLVNRSPLYGFSTGRQRAEST